MLILAHLLPYNFTQADSETTQNLSFQNVKHETNTIDPMPGFGDSGVLIQVTGFIIVRLSRERPFR